MRRFFDANVLAYLFDASAPTKKVRAQELLKQAVSDGVALLSTQVLQEFSSPSHVSSQPLCRMNRPNARYGT